MEVVVVEAMKKHDELLESSMARGEEWGGEGSCTPSFFCRVKWHSQCVVPETAIVFFAVSQRLGDLTQSFFCLFLCKKAFFCLSLCKKELKCPRYSRRAGVQVLCTVRDY